MEVVNNPPRIHKGNLLDRQFGNWWLFLNTCGVSAFLLFLACLGAGEHKHLCALLSSLLMGWVYWTGRNRFPLFIERLRQQNSTASKALEKEIFRDHFFKRLVNYFPFMFGVSTLCILVMWPALRGDWYAYVSFIQR